MAVYLDTSAILKLYVAEEGSEVARRCVSAAAQVASCRIAYAEMRAALAAARRLDRLSASQHGEILGAFQRDWHHYHVVSVTQELVEEAGDLAERHDLRGYDAVHLAAARLLHNWMPASVTLLAWDRDLTRAAERCGLAVMPA